MHVISSVMAHILDYKWREISHLLNEMNGINQFQFELKFKEIESGRVGEKENIGCHGIAKARACTIEKRLKMLAYLSFREFLV